MEYIFQLWGIAPREADWNGLPGRFRRMQDLMPARAVVCGLDAPRKVYRDIAQIARDAGAKTYLWVPVFSEWDHLRAWDALMDEQGAPFLSHRDLPSFRFRCPSGEENVQAVFRESMRHLEMYGGFDGVFLDRIRYPSFQFGLSGVLGCFCPRCLERYRALGLDADALKAACRRVRSRAAARDSNPLGLAGFDGGRWRVQDDVLQNLLDTRCAIVTDSVSALCRQYRQQGLRIGLDVFTPALSYFVGQHFLHLLPLADFIKPMLYLHTQAPAGLPYEIGALEDALGMEAGSFLSLYGADGLEHFAAAEIRRMYAPSDKEQETTRIYCGVEYCRLPGIAPVHPPEIARSAALLRTAGAWGMMPSWSLLSAPEENVSALIRAEKNAAMLSSAKSVRQAADTHP